MSDEGTPAQPSDESTRARHRVRLPGFVSDEEIGLGDVVKRATTSVGIKPCGPCAERARRLNSWMTFAPKR